MCRSNEGDFVHSRRRSQASSRENSSVMAVTLADGSGSTMPPSAADPVSARRTRRPTQAAPVMEKFVIQGGVPLSGTIVPAGNKNGALPILAACLLTADEVILRNVPRISDTE